MAKTNTLITPHRILKLKYYIVGYLLTQQLLLFLLFQPRHFFQFVQLYSKQNK